MGVVEDHGTGTLRFAGPEGGGSLQVGESFSDMDEYVLRRMRVVMPSEHTLLNRRFPIEVQLWHEPAIHRDISMLISDRAEVQLMLRRFQRLTLDWQGELKQLEECPKFGLRELGSIAERVANMGEPANAYNGQIKDGLFHGKGKLIYAGNECYDGEWVYGKREGHGMSACPTYT
eukprot:Skav200350  [mRNA]  locus=scaffold852:101905:117042:- [translate_table: standard]